MNAEEILDTLAHIRANLPSTGAVVLPRALPERRPLTAVEAMLDFELESIAMAAEAIAAALRAAREEEEARLLSQALAVYYAAEELARDPAHADLIPHVEAMRAAYERDYGRAIPPREEAKGMAARTPGCRSAE